MFFGFGGAVGGPAAVRAVVLGNYSGHCRLEHGVDRRRYHQESVGVGLLGILGGVGKIDRG